ncbi:glycine zipper 2TM domain-containing protein [Glaciimonas sp. GG7]
MKIDHNFSHILITTLTGSALLLGGCGSPYGGQQYSGASSYQPAQSGQYAPSNQNGRQAYNGRGVVDAIDVVPGEQSRGIAGAVVGGVLGGVLGHQIGHGSGNTVATIAGAVGGAAVGNQVEQRNSQSPSSYNIRVRMYDNGFQTINVSNPGDLQVGDRVRVENGQISRY